MAKTHSEGRGQARQMEIEIGNALGGAVEWYSRQRAQMPSVMRKNIADLRRRRGLVADLTSKPEFALAARIRTSEGIGKMLDRDAEHCFETPLALRHLPHCRGG